LPTTSISSSFTLSLHDALPISSRLFVMIAEMAQSNPTLKTEQELLMDISAQEVFFNSLSEPLKMSSLSQKVDMTDFLTKLRDDRSEEHTSELQSRFDLVCRLLL